MPAGVDFSPEAQFDPLRLYDYIAERAGEERAFAYAERVRTYCAGFVDFPERGARRDDLRRGLRVVGLDRRISIAFHVSAERVVIDRILYGGRDLESAFRKD